MKKYTVLFCLSCVFLVSTNNFAQSRRATVPDENTSGKINKRPPQVAPIPKPESATPEEEPNNTNIERVSPPVETNTEADGEVITVNTEMVSVPVKILDRKGRFISGLAKENFQVLEDNIPQEIAYFSNEQQPFTVALVLDMSTSSTFKIAEIQNAGLAFVNQLRANDKVMVVAFSEEVIVLNPPTSDRNVLQRAIKSTAIDSGTSLYEAVDLVINKKLKNIAGRKAIVLFTDGVDTTSRKANDMNNLSDALELDALIYPIEYDTFNDVQAMKNKPVIMKPPSPIPSQNKSPFPFPIPTSGIGTPSNQGSSVEDYRRADQYLNDMANRTGGRLYKASTTANLELAFSSIAAELREYYSLGYYPTEKSKEAKSHKIKVRVDKDGLVVRAREGYVTGGKDKKDKKGK